MKHEIMEVKKHSIGEALGIEKGDMLLSIDTHDIADIFDYHLYMASTYIEVEIEKKDQEIWVLEIEKDMEEDVGFVLKPG